MPICRVRTSYSLFNTVFAHNLATFFFTNLACPSANFFVAQTPMHATVLFSINMSSNGPISTTRPLQNRQNRSLSPIEKLSQDFILPYSITILPFVILSNFGDEKINYKSFT